MAAIERFTVAVPESDLDDLRDRLGRTRWPDQLPGVGWSYGTDRDYLRELVEYWRTGYDWRKAEDRLNAWPNYVTEIDGQRLHFVHARSAEPGARPLLLGHGWPSTPGEFLDVIGPLTDPRAHGGAAEDAFHVVIPSIPGYGWSGPTTETGWHPGRVARAYLTLLHELGYEQFYAQGGDYGAVIATQMALAAPERFLGLHLNFLVTAGLRPEDGEPTEAEARLAAEQAVYNATETGYIALQATKPQTIAYALADSPVALAAWIVEKLYRWTDHDGDLESVLTKDQILTTVTTFWLTGTGGSSGRLYYETGTAGMMGPAAERVTVPTSVGVFPKELYPVTRRIAEHHYDVVRWTEQPRGGHFPASEQPDLYVADVRAAFAGPR